jgi:methionyl aminopeptidase
MREAGRILGVVLAEVEKAVRPGLSTLDLDELAEKIMKEHGVIPAFKGYHGFPNTICANINEEVVHGIPNRRPLAEGDLLTVDCGVILDGFYSDSAITAAVGGKTNPEAEKLIKTAYKALDRAIEAVKPGIRTNQISKVIETVVNKEGFGIVHELSGHGIGQNLHEDPFVLNYYEKKLGPVLQAGMTLAIEPIITMGSPRIKTLSDGWTVVTRDGSWAAQVEHTVAITEKGAEILTKRPK